LARGATLLILGEGTGPRKSFFSEGVADLERKFEQGGREPLDQNVKHWAVEDGKTVIFISTKRKKEKVIVLRFCEGGEGGAE